nr:sensor histidine kinase [Oscillospiraceae bacterium]
MENSTVYTQRRSQTMPFFVQAMCAIMMVWFVLLSITLGMTLWYSLNTLQEKIDNSLSSITASLADSATVRQALSEGRCTEEIMDYLDDLVKYTEDLDIISIADRNSIRVYHVVHDRIGKQFVGGDQDRALAGERYFSDAVGTMGYQHRSFSPVFAEDGSVLGFVMASTTQDRLEELRSQIAATYLNLLLILTACTLLFSAGLATYLQRTLRGAKPEDLLKTYLTQNDILNSLDEGLVSLDSDGKIRLVNQAATEALGKKDELLLGQSVDQFLRSESGESLLKTSGKDLPTNRPNLLINSVHLETSSRWARQVLILKDKSEAFRRAEQLNGTRHIVSALRANNHEFMNKLQVISGLLQMGRAQEALNYISNVSATHAQTITPVMQLIQNANVAALILGKLDNMRELDIHMTLLANSSLPEHSAYLSTRELVTVVGNLLENAIEAVNAVSDDRPRNIVLQVTEQESGLLIMISDSGTGIDPADLPHICDQGFSTKAAEGRGVGMSLIRGIVDRHGGSMEVDSEPGGGTTFTLIFSKERGGRGI